MYVHTGGLGFTLKDIGISLTVAGVLMLPMTMFTFPLVRARLYQIHCCQYMHTLFLNTVGEACGVN